MNCLLKLSLLSALCVLLADILQPGSLVEGQNMPMMMVEPQYCNKTEMNLTMGWDDCNGKTSGRKYQSKSTCYQNSVTMKFTYRYDYFICKNFMGRKMLIPKNCSTPIYHDVNKTLICNRFVEATQMCSCDDNCCMMQLMALMPTTMPPAVSGGFFG